jgi:HSP20 family protein
VLDEMMDVDRRLNRVLQATADRVSGRYPRVNIYAGDDGAMVDAELPGIDPSTVEVAVDARVLTIKGKRPGEGEEERPFERRFELPFAVAEEGLNAKYACGVLRVTLPKAPEAKPRRIAITAA